MTSDIVYIYVCVYKIMFSNYFHYYRDVGGIRASTYNAVTVEEVETLVKYMKEFYEKHSK